MQVWQLFALADGNDERTTSDLSESLRRRGETRTYHAYVAKQQSKLALYPEKIRAIDVARQHQVRREFAAAVARGTAGVAGFGGRTVLCLGARLGGEVRAFKSLGAVAVGIDLEPGRGNMDVVFGDFHDVPFAADSFDYAYSNVLDHIYDLRRFGREVARVVKPGGLFLLALPGRLRRRRRRLDRKAGRVARRSARLCRRHARVRLRGGRRDADHRGHGSVQRHAARGPERNLAPEDPHDLPPPAIVRG